MSLEVLSVFINSTIFKELRQSFSGWACKMNKQSELSSLIGVVLNLRKLPNQPCLPQQFVFKEL